MSSNRQLVAMILCSHVVLAGAADADKEAVRTVQDERACAGVTNENTKMRELRRELGAYLGQTVPEELQNKVRRHIDLVARLKAECDQQRDQSALAK